MSRNIEKLRRLMKTYNLTQAQVAEMLQVSLNTVKAWFARPGSKRYCRLNNTMLNLLNAELVRRKLKSSKNHARYIFEGIMYTEARVANAMTLMSAGKIVEANENLEKVLETISAISHLLFCYGEENLLKDHHEKS